MYKTKKKSYFISCILNTGRSTILQFPRMHRLCSQIMWCLAILQKWKKKQDSSESLFPDSYAMLIS